ncbi:MAG: PAS domain S-box protein [Acetobacteraceae bacterium]
MAETLSSPTAVTYDDREFGLAMEAAEVGAWRWDVAAGILHLSTAARALLELPESAAAYSAFLARVHPADRMSVERSMREASDRGEVYDLDFRTSSSDGIGRWLRLCGRAHSRQGRGTEAWGILIDVTRRKAAEEAKSRLAAIVASSEDAIIAKTLEGIVTDWNAGAEGIFGYSAEEMIGKPVSLLLPPGQEDEGASILERLKRGERVEHFETSRRCKNGNIIDVSLTISPLRDHDGRLVGASKVARDITASKRAQMALAEREAHLQSVLDTVPDAMIVIDPQGIIQSFSATAERQFGYRADEAIGRNVSMLMPSPYREQHDSYLKRYLVTGDRHVIGIGRLVAGRRKDGSTFSIELSVGEVRAGQRRVFTGFARDLSEREESQKRLQDLQGELIRMSRFTALGEMASTLAHELNQPLSAVANYLKGAGRLLAGDQPEAVRMAREAMEKAVEQALRAGQIIRRLRDFVARGESERRLENLAKLIEEASALALVGVKEAGVRVSFQLDPQAEAVFADKIQIQQVLLNLIRNAVEAMQESVTSKLVVASQKVDEETVEVSVTDTGSGISEEIAARLFQPFVTTKRNGMGVGLSISRTIVEAHGGRLWVERNPVGGTIFRLTLKTTASAEALEDGT